ncbi:MAG: group II intron reverse transcriptase domain-containing protein [Planctomycetes bacterium]|nr:group II intron reverse transcriptase domain-containing protein [Planctomycetota bacterium]
MSADLAAGRWRPSGYRTFRIAEPKERLICAAPFADRVVHQAVVQVIEPLFEPSFIHDSYACRRGRGTHRALRRVSLWAGTYPWCLKLDVEKYFPSVDHDICLELAARKLHCPPTLEILRRILGTWTTEEAPRRWFPGDDLFSPGLRSRGLPIGNLTSQFLSNVYLDPVDHRVKDGLGIRPYARYCDDLVVLGHSPEELRRVRSEIVRALRRLRLTAHPRKTQIFPTAQGIPWLGFTVYPDQIHLRRENLRRARRRFRRFAGLLQRGEGDPVHIQCSVDAWRAHAQHASSPKLADALTACFP